MNQQQLRVHTQNVPTGSDVDSGSDSDSAHTIKQRPQKERGGGRWGGGRQALRVGGAVGNGIGQGDKAH